MNNMFFALYTYSHYSTEFDRAVGTVAIWFVGVVALLGLLGLAGQILLGLAVYNDAKAKGNTEPVMWGVLTGIFGLIPGIIYLCVRNNNRNRLIVCPNCGFTHRISEFNCPQCGVANPFAQQFSNPLTQTQQSRANKLLIAAIIIWVVTIIGSIIAMVWFTTAIMNAPGTSFYY
jgi:predicted RNA-binding Zn-ribbon protein involved in translation (DUF1610 family)